MELWGPGLDAEVAYRTEQMIGATGRRRGSRARRGRGGRSGAPGGRGSRAASDARRRAADPAPLAGVVATVVRTLGSRTARPA